MKPCCKFTAWNFEPGDEHVTRPSIMTPIPPLEPEVLTDRAAHDQQRDNLGPLEAQRLNEANGRCGPIHAIPEEQHK